MNNYNQDTNVFIKEQLENNSKENKKKDIVDTVFPHLNIKSFLGLLFIYLIVLCSGIYISFHYFTITRFLLYLSNVDLLSNTLATAFPDVFKLAYNPDPDSLISYLSYNTISMIALTGIFIAGLHMKSVGKSDAIALQSMIIVGIVTYTLPTNLIPILTKLLDKFIENYIIHEKLNRSFGHAVLKLVIGLIVAIGFIGLEEFILKQNIYTKTLTSGGKRLFNTFGK
mgnify:CR=1 FL=1|jgi:hypothetical protein